MKNFKKIVSLLLVALMVFAMSVAVFADDDEEETATTGTITIHNAEIGKTYSLYKIFDATYDGTDAQGKKIVSYSTSDADVIAAIQADMEKAAAAGVCPFTLQGDADENGAYTVVHKADVSETIGRGWIKDHLDLFEKVWEEECESGNDLVTELPYGYYLMNPGVALDELDDYVISVDTNTPNVVINDKNDRQPNTPDKTSPKKTAAVGDKVPFQVSFLATNFRTQSSQTQQIIKYKVADEATGLTYGTTGTVKLYATKDESTGAFSDELTDYTVDYTYDEENDVLTIPWVDDEGESLYPSPVWVVIDYEMTLNTDTFGTDDDWTKYAINKAHVTYTLEDTPTKDNPVGEDPEVRVYTTGISIRKLDAADVSKFLYGAEFILYKMNGQNKVYYKWDESKGVAGEVTWVSSASAATVAEADNLFETMEFPGLDVGTYYIKEIKAPEGYNIPASDFTVVITANEKSNQVVEFAATIDGQSATHQANNTLTVQIKNTAGTVLPSTGGTGTFILIAVGSVLFIGTAVVLVAKKRMYNEG